MLLFKNQTNLFQFCVFGAGNNSTLSIVSKELQKTVSKYSKSSTIIKLTRMR